MSEKLEQLGTQALQDLLTNMTQAKAFVLEQAPDVVREIVLLGRIQNTAEVMASLVFFVFALFLLFKGIKEQEEPFFMLGAFLSMGGIFLTMISFSNAALVWFAPKLYVIKEIGELIK